MAVAAVGRGASCNAAARELGCATSTVVSAVRRYREEGRRALRERREGNGQRKVDERFRKRLAQVLVTQFPASLTSPLLGFQDGRSLCFRVSPLTCLQASKEESQGGYGAPAAG
ncbi:helix-turn-helix domain-containing protein [Myxococcus fulvus]|uniref:helix-turn-helix domain-containing protein n=1 Tax=Myxococcus fulvus TaxID=33 RepID=UPI003B9A597E